MLKNDPPSGTKVKFTRPILQKAKVNDTAILVRSTRRYLVERADDEFEVQFRGELLKVQRADIEEY
jgi:hypothetical protein